MDPNSVFPDSYTDSSTSESSSSSSSNSDVVKNPSVSESKLKIFPTPVYVESKHLKHRLNAKVATQSTQSLLKWSKRPFIYELDKSLSAKVDARVVECKLKHRPVLKDPVSDWRRYGFYEKFDKYKKNVLIEMKDIEAEHESMMIRRNKGRSMWYYKIGSQTVDRFSYKDISIQDFDSMYVYHSKPCIITDIADEWPARSEWNDSAFSKSSLRSTYLRCGEDNDGYSVKMRLKYFLHYMKTQKDDSPLYMFDSNYKASDGDMKKCIIDAYDIPSFFKKDLFADMPDKRRPPNRWFCMGPERSGTHLHCDPLATSAWNTVTDGIKLWVMFPPNTARRWCIGKSLKKKGEDDEAITWYLKVFPRIKEDLKKNKRHVEIYEFLQFPGDTIFVPGGWWHAVLNLTDTIAVTQNFVTEPTFDKAWRKVRSGRKHMARRWLRMLHEKKETQKLSLRAKELNVKDKFCWRFSKRKAAKLVGKAPSIPDELRYVGDCADDELSSNSTDSSEESEHPPPRGYKRKRVDKEQESEPKVPKLSGLKISKGKSDFDMFVRSSKDGDIDMKYSRDVEPHQQH